MNFNYCHFPIPLDIDFDFSTQPARRLLETRVEVVDRVGLFLTSRKQQFNT
jgi:hypothetical protein